MEKYGRDIRALLLDLDGVVLDTEGQYSAFWGWVGREKFPHVPDFARRIKGQTLVRIKADYFASEEDLAWIDRELDTFERQMDYPYVPGAEELLRECMERGIPTALVTSSDQAKMRKVHERHPELAGLFARIFTAEDFQRSKPAPDCYIGAARLLGLNPAECIVVEDSPNGLRAARDSGACVVGITTTCPAEQIRPLADVLVESLDEVRAFLR
jgi:HAD superfamily hydrolase (TIGR01509 family)